MNNPIGNYYSSMFAHRETLDEALHYAQSIAKSCHTQELYVMTAVMVVLNTAIKIVDEAHEKSN